MMLNQIPCTPSPQRDFFLSISLFQLICMWPGLQLRGNLICRCFKEINLTNQKLAPAAYTWAKLPLISWKVLSEQQMGSNSPGCRDSDKSWRPLCWGDTFYTSPFSALARPVLLPVLDGPPMSSHSKAAHEAIANCDQLGWLRSSCSSYVRHRSLLSAP